MHHIVIFNLPRGNSGKYPDRALDLDKSNTDYILMDSMPRLFEVLRWVDFCALATVVSALFRRRRSECADIAGVVDLIKV
jgi:hypothetical protein